MMDTFHDCVEKHGLKTKRIHFHEFMIMVHNRAHELGPIGQPMTKIARQIARETRVLCFDEFQVISYNLVFSNVIFAKISSGVVRFFFSFNSPTIRE